MAHELLFCQHFHIFAFHVLEALHKFPGGGHLQCCPQALVRCDEAGGQAASVFELGLSVGSVKSCMCM